MSAEGYRVVAPLVFAYDQVGKLHQRYYGAYLPFLNDEQREHFLRHGLIEEVKGKEAEAIAPEGAVKPAKTAPQKDWVEFGVYSGHDRAELDKLSKQDLIELLG